MGWKLSSPLISFLHSLFSARPSSSLCDTSQVKMPEASLLLLNLSLSFLFLFLPLVHSQGTNATCLSSFEWTTNSWGQNPCLVGAYLLASCQSNGDWFIPSLNNLSTGYPGPNRQAANSCGCSSVTYSLLSACSYCQNGQINTWSSYISKCYEDDVRNGDFPGTIPTTTVVPAWAFRAVNTTYGKWDSSTSENNVEDGLADITGPGVNVTLSSASPESASTTVTITTSTPQTITSPTDTTADVVPGSFHKSNKGPIVGGILAGVAAAMLVAVVTFIMRRSIRSKRKLRAPSRQIQLNPPLISPGYDQKFPLDLTPPPSANPLLNQMNPQAPSPIYDPFRSSSRVTIYKPSSSDGHSSESPKPQQSLFVREEV
ncbi:hypothetical protein QCA50_011651 [Cerrena zonata]|uniref:Transmembrane protein n=1 Tax=Cerrena zonata TaxID=2478898 RepID=A0AAW0FW42_9APHY